MTRAHDPEVAVIEGRKLGLIEPLGHGQHGAVDESDFQIRVDLEQLTDPLVIAGRQIFDRQRSAPHLFKDGAEGFIPRVPPE